jgi:hypothetical protein
VGNTEKFIPHPLTNSSPSGVPLQVSPIQWSAARYEAILYDAFIG